jgi:hypothetical protein
MFWPGAMVEMLWNELSIPAKKAREESSGLIDAVILKKQCQMHRKLFCWL